ncbi:MAG: Gfo/Idh/MocA family oxidoreductase, partial [Acidobacteria bacterium]|nr:Gfo/Idh/MocA family oxidoreductase [Acidobacteriota bacterium]
MENRRDFIRTAATALTAASYSRILGANERVNLVIIGIGGRGRSHISSYAELADCRIAGICDVNQAAQERGEALVLKATNQKPKIFSDMRKVFEDKEVEAVSMPTPNHWHALGTIWACQAGKDVYVEKPACHNIYEGRKMVEAARKYKRMVMVGSQSRSTAHVMKAMQLLHEGVIGKLYLSKGLCYKRRASIGHKPDLDSPPPGLNWDMFLGPAPMRKFNENRFAYNWHWFWDTGNGDLGNQGVHQMDVVRWGLGVDARPKWVFSSGGKYIYDDDQETPNTQTVTLDYGDKQLVFEVRGLFTGGESGVELRGRNAIGNLFYGSDGWMALDGTGFRVYKGESREKVMDQPSQRGDTSPHMANFLKAVKTRDAKHLTAEVEIGADSAALCHLGNISYRLGRKLA